MNVPMCIEELVSQLSNTTLFWRLTLINKLGAYLYEKPKTERKKEKMKEREKEKERERMFYHLIILYCTYIAM